MKTATKILAVICQKGGVGKTAIAVNLAVEANRARRKVVLIDIDKQASATNWNGERDEGQRLDVVKTDLSGLAAALAAAEQRHAELIIIDTPGKTEATTVPVSRLADFVLIPTYPFFVDMKPAVESAHWVRSSGKPHAFVINQATPGHVTTEEARAILEGCGFPVFPDVVHRCADIYHSSQGGSAVEYNPDGKAAEEIKKLFNTLKKVMSL